MNLCWIIKYKGTAAKEIKKLEKSVISRILDTIGYLKEDPFLNARKLEGSDNIYRKRVGSFRIIYEIITLEKTIIITAVLHRKKSYREF